MDENLEEIRKNREDIIKQTMESESVNSLFGDIINGNKKFLSENAMEYKETEKFGIIVTGKGGSTIVNHLIRDNNLSSYDTDKQNRVHEFIKENRNFLDTTYTEEIKFIPELQEFKKIMNGESKKDLIIVTRNPIYKWMSGLIQELTDEMQSSVTLASFISDKYNFLIDDIGSLFENKKIKEDLKKQILSDLAFRYLHGSLIKNGTTLINHMYLYNEIYYLFLENNKIDLSKLKIVDIDSDKGDLVDIFKMYYPEIPESMNTAGFWTHRYKWDLALSNLQNFLENNDIVASQILKTEVQRDLYYYNLLLKKYNKNLIK